MAVKSLESYQLLENEQDEGNSSKSVLLLLPVRTTAQRLSRIKKVTD